MARNAALQRQGNIAHQATTIPRCYVLFFAPCFGCFCVLFHSEFYDQRIAVILQCFGAAPMPFWDWLCHLFRLAPFKILSGWRETKRWTRCCPYSWEMLIIESWVWMQTTFSKPTVSRQGLDGFSDAFGSGLPQRTGEGSEKYAGMAVGVSVNLHERAKDPSWHMLLSFWNLISIPINIHT